MTRPDSRKPARDIGLHPADFPVSQASGLLRAIFDLDVLQGPVAVPESAWNEWRVKLATSRSSLFPFPSVFQVPSCQRIEEELARERLVLFYHVLHRRGVDLSLPFPQKREGERAFSSLPHTAAQIGFFA